ncbi:CDP-alcohol phosphatidyltransferase family protein [Pseudonocardia endophytica]|uniref:Phosphatidylglycerophosphate synthase n=1 Tax=Pseudonocardia endophytica TaxID=401976 RepID=A0A4R1HTA4_PSEEN|nr:CDP-alcohol phosphatidyltransferase family protein [Pseudonocardia endophytica]TCK25904.1 phosphatidylglycerophosphate synthase [Pseudonocardia endophytica]
MTLPPTVTVSARGADIITCAAAVLLLVSALGPAGVGPFGLLAATGNAVVVLVLLDGALRRAGRDTLGPADRVTLVRALLGACVTGFVVDGLVSGSPAVAALVAVAAVALALDAVDGQVARRTGTVSAVGARFDMESDAWLIMVLSVQVATELGAWVLAIGLMRYAFVAAGRAVPWLRGPLTPARGSKTIAAVQGVVLATAASGLIGVLAGTVLVAVALALLCFSFGRDVVRLHRAKAIPVVVIPQQRTVGTVSHRAARERRDASAAGVRRARAGHADVCDPVAG